MKDNDIPWCYNPSSNSCDSLNFIAKDAGFTKDFEKEMYDKFLKI